MNNRTVNNCSYYDSFLGTCSLYVVQVDNFDDLGWEDAKCREVQDCEFKGKLTKEYKEG